LSLVASSGASTTTSALGAVGSGALVRSNSELNVDVFLSIGSLLVFSSGGRLFLLLVLLFRLLLGKGFVLLGKRLEISPFGLILALTRSSGSGESNRGCLTLSKEFLESESRLFLLFGLGRGFFMVSSASSFLSGGSSLFLLFAFGGGSSLSSSGFGSGSGSLVAFLTVFTVFVVGCLVLNGFLKVLTRSASVEFASTASLGALVGSWASARVPLEGALLGVNEASVFAGPARRSLLALALGMFTTLSARRAFTTFTALGMLSI
jgi:hypothetical protein